LKRNCDWSSEWSDVISGVGCPVSGADNERRLVDGARRIGVHRYSVAFLCLIWGVSSLIPCPKIGYPDLEFFVVFLGLSRCFPPFSAEVKNAWSYTSTPLIRLHGVGLS
jgi:hypothetical protein